MTIKLVKKLKPGLTALLLSVSFCATAAPVALDKIVAIVNDDIVLQSELSETERSIRGRLATQGRAIPDDQVLQRQILDRLILENIQLQLGEQQGIRISDSELNSALERIASRSGLSLEQFRETLIAEGQDYTQARQQIRSEMLIQKIQQRIVSSRIRVSQQEIDNFLASEQGKQQNAANYRLSQILISVPLQATPQMIQKAEQQAQNVAKELNDGADFAATAIAQSKGPNALKGGDIGWRKLNEIPEQFAAVVDDLNPGQFSAPVRSPSGFHILKVNDKQGSSVQLVEQVQVRQIGRASCRERV